MSEKQGDQEFYAVDEIAELIGWNRATVYEWIKALGLRKHKFVRNRKTYLAAPDVERLKEIKEKPWTAGEKKSHEAA